jgi:hypothetical protein
MLLNNLHKIGIKYVLPVIKYSFIKLSNNDQLFSFTGPIINTEKRETSMNQKLTEEFR